MGGVSRACIRGLAGQGTRMNERAEKKCRWNSQRPPIWTRARRHPRRIAAERGEVVGAGRVLDWPRWSGETSPHREGAHRSPCLARLQTQGGAAFACPARARDAARGRWMPLPAKRSR